MGWRLYRDREVDRLAFERETDLQRHLVMADLAILDMPTRLDHLEPPQVLKRLCRAADGYLDCVFDRFFRRPDQFDDLIDMFGFAGCLCLFGNRLWVNLPEASYCSPILPG